MTDETTDNSSAPDTEYSAAQAYKDSQDAESLAGEVKTEGEPATEETKETEAPTAEEEAAKEPEELEDEEEDLPKLDAKALEAIGDNPVAQEAWKRAWKGVTKRETQLTAKETAFRQETEGYDTYIDLEKRLTDPQQAAQVLETLVTYTKNKLGIDLPWFNKTGDIPAVVPLEGPEPWKKDGFEFEGEWKAYKRATQETNQQIQQAVEATRRQMMEQFGNPEEIRQMVAQNAETARIKKQDEYINGLTPRVVSKAKANLWEGVDKAMVAKAALEYPELIKTDSLEALKKTFPDKWAEVVSGKKKVEMAMVEPATLSGRARTADPMNYSAAEAYADVS